MIRVTLAALISCLFLLAHAQTETSPEHTTIIEANHYFSNYEVNNTYKIDKVSIDRPLIFILKKKDENSIFDNDLTITLISGDKQAECILTSYSGMCLLDQLPSPDMKMGLRCAHLPCDISWTILQPSMKQLKGKQNVEDLYEIAETNSHLVAMVSCNNAEVKNFNKLVQAYSEDSFIRGYSHDIIYFLFEKGKKGHIYFKVEPEAKACAQMTVHNTVTTLKPDETYRDFVTSGSDSIYKFEKRP